MRAVVDAESHVVAYLFEDDVQVCLTDKSMFAGGVRALDVSCSTHVVVDVPRNDLFCGSLWTWTTDDGWSCTDQQALIELIYPRIYAEVGQTIQALLDATAQSCGYDTIHTACGWAGRIDDATALADWGAACWAKSKEIKAAILSGNRPIMTAAHIMDEIPLFSDYFSEPV